MRLLWNFDLNASLVPHIDEGYQESQQTAHLAWRTWLGDFPSNASITRAVIQFMVGISLPTLVILAGAVLYESG
jgi:hypothetical protein